jgi:hypothetical protein
VILDSKQCKKDLFSLESKVQDQATPSAWHLVRATLAGHSIMSGVMTGVRVGDRPHGNKKAESREGLLLLVLLDQH